ncbi:pleckstrin homology domain-containing family G member 7 isoform X2 [Denticeps clupeoides]|uniref:pleckstrin homology domain-containing family G member 7 isoform X2 n=1 Tax=Denticeps clupeoides TaxID=299321 RepID=UPI0010A4C37C|nr:pleckstrin homology domain-containing family G member 7 isoform X2 [Denticeps clupeoides]
MSELILNGQGDAGKKAPRGPDRCCAETQTDPGGREDRETQTCNPFLMRMDSRLVHGPGREVELFQFDRQAPARISTSPTLRRMRSTRHTYGDFREIGRMDAPREEFPWCPLSPGRRQKSPLAATDAGQAESAEPRGKTRTIRSKTLVNGVTCDRDGETGDSGTGDSDDEVEEACSKRLQERRRSSVVVSLPGLDMSPGDLFVSNGAADLLNHSTYSDTKKSKWPFMRRSTTKGKTRTSSDIEKHLSAIQVGAWRDSHFQRYKDSTLEEFLRAHWPMSQAAQDSPAFRKQEAIWELFTSECVYFMDQLMVIKEVFVSTLADLQMRDCLQDIDCWRLFANLSELCMVSHDFLTSLLRVIKESWQSDGDSSQTLLNLLKKKYCLNYSTAVLYLDTLKLREDFGTYVKWCERKEQCRRLQLKDLLVVPLQRLTRYPLLLKNIGKRIQDEDEQSSLRGVVEQVDRAIYDLEGRVKWLDNYQKVEQLKEALVWLPVWERDKRAHISENLKHLIKSVTLENLISHRSLLHEGRLLLAESAKVHEVFVFLFDEFLLITKIKRNKKRTGLSDSTPLRPVAGQELEQLLQDCCTFTVLDQPVSLDRLQLKNVDQLNATASSLPHSFIIMHQNRYQQCIAVFILQAPTEAAKKTWMSEIEGAVTTLLKQDSSCPRIKSTSLWLESSQI